MPSQADVYVYRVEFLDDETKVVDWARGTKEEVEQFCRRPAWPARETDSFIAVDDWGHGVIIAATPDLQNQIGQTYREFKARCHKLPANLARYGYRV